MDEFKINKITKHSFEMIYINGSTDIWQKPVITELQIFQNLSKERSLPFNYIAFPWANYIDNKWTHKFDAMETNINNELTEHNVINDSKTYFTVVQHIEFRNYIETFVRLNIKYIFTPHKMTSDVELENKYNIHIIPISLFPKQNNDRKVFIDVKSKPYLMSFIGQISHENNISNIRKHIYDLYRNKTDCFIRANNEWYYEKFVYKNAPLTETCEDMVFKQNMIDSKFSLCPSGTGPNSIRIWESISFGCIPVILADTLVLPELPNVNYNSFCILWKEANIHELYDHLKTISESKLNAMISNCKKIYTLYFSKDKIHNTINAYFKNIPRDFNWEIYLELNADLKHMNQKQAGEHYLRHGIYENRRYKHNELPLIKQDPVEEIIRDDFTFQYDLSKLNQKQKIVLITQYYLVNGECDDYNKIRQKEIDHCLRKNVNNNCIDEIHLFLEEDIELPLNRLTIKPIVKVITGKRINFKDVFDYSNKHLTNCVCVLLNSDVYLDKSIRLVDNICFSDKLFISLNRFENNDDALPPLLNGTEINEADMKSCQAFLLPYQASIWSQDGWIWKPPLENIDETFRFNLGVVGCDNYLNYNMNKKGYNILNCSSLICINHYDRLSIVQNEFGISKGNVSKKKNTTIGDSNTFLFLENQHDIPDCFTIKTNKSVKSFSNMPVKINELIFKKRISEIKIHNFQVTASSHLNDACKPSNALFSNENYWSPNNEDVHPFIQFNFENFYEIAVIDISGKPVSRFDYTCGYVTRFNISYIGVDNRWITGKTVHDGITINNGNYIKKIYLNAPILCHSIKIIPLDFVSLNALKIRFYSINHAKPDFFNYLCHNPVHFKLLDKPFFNYEHIGKTICIKDERKSSSAIQRTHNELGEQIEEGICLFVYVMNRNQNIHNNIHSWLKQQIQQLIVLDWNSTDTMYEFVNSLNDSRVIYIRVENEPKFIRTFAQNLAARFCKYNKICKVDSDVILSDFFFENHPINPGEFYVGEWRCARCDNEKHLHGNAYLYLNDYFRVNGYNEYIKDYGWDDSDFTIRLMACGLTKKVFNYDYMYHVPHDEQSRTQNLINPKNSLLMVLCNQEYLKDIVWNRDHLMQEFSILKQQDNLFVCNRIKTREYCIDEHKYEIIVKEKTKIMKLWKLM